MRAFSVVASWAVAAAATALVIAAYSPMAEAQEFYDLLDNVCNATSTVCTSDTDCGSDWCYRAVVPYTSLINNGVGIVLRQEKLKGFFL
jgi:hypothetical protein